MRFREYYLLLGEYRGSKSVLAKKLKVANGQLHDWAQGIKGIFPQYWEKIEKITQGHVTREDLYHEYIEWFNDKGTGALRQRAPSKPRHGSRAMGGDGHRAKGMRIPIREKRDQDISARVPGDHQGSEMPLSGPDLPEQGPSPAVLSSIAQLMEGVRKGKGAALQAANTGIERGDR
jgi:DNA-binding transcriptional regulator YdaS (Cro superfamily)